MNDIAPGWYKDPAEPTTQRYWDGEGWIGESLPIDATPPSEPPVVAPTGTVTLPPTPAPAEVGAPAGTPAGQPPTRAESPAAEDEAPGAEGQAQPGAGTAPPPGWPQGVPAPGAPVPPPGTWPPGAWPPGAGRPGQPGAGQPGAWPPGSPVPPPGSWPPGSWPPPSPQNLPPGVPPGSIPWPPGVPVPPGYRIAYGYAAAPRPHGLPVAPLGLRFLARLIDFLIVLGLNVVATGWLVYLFISDYAPLVSALAHQTSYDNLPAVPGRVSVLSYVIPLVAMAVWLAYEVPAIAHRGQTFGKRVVGIKVMPLESEQPLGFRRALRRWSPLGVPMLLWSCGLGFILQLVDSISPAMGGPLQLALHDRSAATVVVHVGRRGHEITPVKAQEKTGAQS